MELDTSHGLVALAPRASRGAPVRLRAPGSKSSTQRALVCAALAEGESRLEQPLDCDDTRALRRALTMLGVGIVDEPARWLVRGGRLRTPGQPVDCHDGGTTARFLAPMALLLDGPLVLDGSARLRERPLAPLLDALGALGVVVTAGGEACRLPVTLSARAAAAPLPAPPRVRVDATASSQFASALLLVGPALPAGLTVELAGEAVSRPYLELTRAVMRAFGARVQAGAGGLVVEPGRYRPTTFTIEGDWSSAALLFAAGFVARRTVELDGLSVDSAQGDRVIVSLLTLLDEPGSHELDLRDCPDLVAPLAVAAVASGGRVVLGGVAHARHKESDRLAVLAHELGSVGARITLVGDALVVDPGSILRPGQLNPHGDHRMAMAFGALSLRQPGLRIGDPGCVSKSFPGFWDALERLR